MSNLIRIAEQVLNRPLLVHPDKVPLILSVLSGRIPLDTGAIAELREEAEARIADLPANAQLIMNGPAPDASRFYGSSYEVDQVSGRASSLPYRRTPDGVAMIPILGGLANRGTSLTNGSMSKQSYEGLKFQFMHAAGDPKTTAVILDMESPGGQAVGAFEAADAVRALAAEKPVFAVVNGMAASAAYAIASGATRIYTAPSGISGSIGVVMMHADFSRALDKQGVTPTLIFAGAHKADGNPLEPLSRAVRADLQAEVDQFYEMFVETVAKGRPGMSPKAIRDTEARTFMGADAVRAGLADDVGTFEDALAELSRRGDRRASTANAKGTSSMAVHDVAPAAGTNAGIPKDQHDAAVAAARAEGVTEGSKAGAASERARIGSILSLEEAQGRQAQALSIATTTDLSADQAKAILAAAPKPVAGLAARAADAPLGIVLDAGATRAEASEMLSADELAADTSKEFAPRAPRK